MLSGHTVQRADPLTAANRPGSQSSHLVDPSLEKVPGVHTVQTWSFSYVPAGQRLVPLQIFSSPVPVHSGVHPTATSISPALEGPATNPSWGTVQLMDRSPAANFPSSQLWHVFNPFFDAYVPGTQGKQLPCPSTSWCHPFGQLSHTELSSSSPALNCPTSQAEQLPPYRPAAHAEHAAAPVYKASFPIGQGKHEVN